MFLTSKKLMYDTVFVVMEVMTTVPWKAQDLELDVALATWRTTSRFCCHCSAIVVDEPPSPWEFVGAVNEERLVGESRLGFVDCGRRYGVLTRTAAGKEAMGEVAS